MSMSAETSDTPQAVSLATLPVGEMILVETRNSQYRVVLTDPQDGRACIEGGNAFPEPSEVRVVGATSGSGVLKPGSINVGLGLEILTGDHYLVTSAVRSIHLMHRAGQRRRAPRATFIRAETLPRGPEPNPAPERPLPPESYGVL
ncbi:MAG: hypothetical protein ACREKS_13055 [Candidatus Rokuibacteriota bacterium]